MTTRRTARTRATNIRRRRCQCRAPLPWTNSNAEGRNDFSPCFLKRFLFFLSRTLMSIERFFFFGRHPSGILESQAYKWGATLQMGIIFRFLIPALWGPWDGWDTRSLGFL